MIFSGISIDNKTVDSLIDILKAPQKSADFLKNIKKETAALNKIRKEIGGMTSAKKYTDGLKKEASEAQDTSRVAIASIKTEEKKAKATAKKLADKQIKLAEDAIEKTASLAYVIKEYEARTKEIALLEEKLVKREQAVEANHRKAESLRDEYKAKLKDLKDRMAGL